MNKHTKQDKADIQDEFMGEIVNIMDDVIEVKDESGQIHSFKITGLEVLNEFEELDEFEELETLDIGDRIKVNIEKGRATSIEKVEGGTLSHK